MKRILACILLLLVMLGGCSTEEVYRQPVNFYYVTGEMHYQIGSTLIASELREGQNSGTIEDQIALYLKGPQSSELTSPFPAGVHLINFRCDQGTAYITLSRELSILSNMELTVACSCIALTCLDLTDAEQVCIEAEGCLLDGKKNIIMDRNTLLLTDIVTAHT